MGVFCNQWHSKYINKRICNIWRYIRGIPILFYYLLGVVWKVFAGVLSPDLSNEGANASIKEEVSVSFWIVALIVAPLLETILCQVLPIEICNRVAKKCAGKSYVLFSILISAILFAVEHRFSIGYMFYAFIMGLYLAFFYVYTFKAYGKRWGIGLALTALLHLLYNLLACVAVIILR